MQGSGTIEAARPLADNVAVAYRRDGFAVVRGVFGRGDVAELQHAFDRQRDAALRLGRSWRHGNLCYRLVEDPRAGLVVTMAQWPSYGDPVLARFRNDPRVLDIVAPLIGQDLKQIINQCHWKPRGAALAAYNYHQDARFRRPRAAFRHLDTSYVQTAIAVDPHRRANGALRLAPGSHRLGWIAALCEGPVLGADRGEASLARIGIEPSTLVDLELEPGDVALWHPYTVHGSGGNAGGDERRFYLNSYVRAADCDRGEWAFRGGTPSALGAPVLVHYEELFSRPEPHFLDNDMPPSD